MTSYDDDDDGVVVIQSEELSIVNLTRRGCCTAGLGFSAGGVCCTGAALALGSALDFFWGLAFGLGSTFGCLLVEVGFCSPLLRLCWHTACQGFRYSVQGEEQFDSDCFSLIRFG
jgi:hypothetical protein